MSNPFDLSSIEETNTPPVSDNPFALRTIEQDQAKDLRVEVQRATRTNPDQAAEASRLAKRYALPEEVALRNLPEITQQATADDVMQTLNGSPIVAQHLRENASTARQAHDDVAALAKLEQDAKQFGTLKAWSGPEATFANVAKGLAKSVPQGFEAARLGLQAQMGDFLEYLGITQPDPVYKADQQRKLAQATGASSFTTPEFESSTAQGVYGGAASFLRVLPAAALTVATRSPVPMLTAAGVQTEAEAYAKYRGRGGAAGESFAGAVGEGAVEVATEYLGSKYLAKALGRTGAGEFLVNLLAREIPGEQVATLLQDAIDTAVANPSKTWQEYLTERPDAAYQTLVATVTQSAIMGGINAGANRILRNSQEQDAANVGAEQLQNALQTATGSLLRERNPEQFRALVARMAENTEGAPQEIYIDAEVLNQLPQEVLAQLPQSVIDALPDALASNDVVSLPVADVLTVAPGTALEQMIVENARIGDPMAMTQGEAKIAGEQAQQYLTQEADRVIAQATDQQAMQESADRVKQGVLDQLNTAARFSPAVNEAYATWTTAFYTTMGGRLGLQPEEMAARYQLRIGAQGKTDEVLLGQITPEQAMQTNVPVEMPTALEFAEAVGNTPGAQITENGLLIDLVRFQKPEQEGAQAIRTGVFYLPAKSADVRHYRNAKTGYGGGERFAGQTLVRRPLFVKGATGGAAPEQAYRQLKGKEALAELSRAVMQVITKGGNYMRPNPALKLQLIEEFFDQYAPEQSGSASELERVSREGNALRYALQELAVAHAVRAAGYDAVVGYSKKKTGAAISEVFDVREQTFPARGMDSEVHEAYNQQDQNYLVAFDKVDDTIEITAPQVTEQEIDDAERLFLSAFPEGVTTYRRKTGIARSLRRASDDATNTVGEDPSTTRTVESPLGPFSGYEVIGQAVEGDEFFAPDGTLKVKVFGKEQVEAGLTEEPALTFTVTRDGELSVNGPTPGGATFNEFAARGWAEQSKAGDQIAAGWSNLVMPDGGRMPLNQLVPLLGDVHARVRAWRMEDNVGLHWSRATGASAGLGDYGSAVFFQGTKQARGTFDPDSLSLALNENADLSTFLHETAHFFLEVTADLSSQPNAPAEVQADMAALLKWFGIDRAQWDAWQAEYAETKSLPKGLVRLHERFAESFEQYLLEGKAPSLELQPLFRKFKRWMENVYTSLKAFIARHPDNGMVLSDEIRQVFDRMLATREQIAQAEEVAGMVPNEDATEAAVEKLTARSLRDLKWTVNARAKAIKKLQKEAATLRKGVEAEVRAEVEAMPVYAAQLAMRKDSKLDIAALEQLYAGEGDRYALLDWKSLITRKMAGKNGTHPDVVADMFGYESGDALVRAVLAAEPMASAIEGMTDQRMLEEHGDLIDDRAIAEAANEAVHNDARARSLATELKAQADALGARTDTGETNAKGSKVTVSVLAEAAKQFAANVIAKTPIKDLKGRAWQHVAAERRAGKRWQEATAGGKTEEAIKAKQDQMLNNAAAKAANEAQAEAKKIMEFFRRVVKDNNEKTVEKGRDPDVVNAARAILVAYGIAPRAGKSAREYMDVLKANNPASYAELEPIMQDALNAAQPLDALTMDELRSLNDAIDALWFKAKRDRQMEVDGKMIDLEDAEGELQSRMQVIGVPDTLPGEAGAITTKQKAQRMLQHAGSLLRRAEQWAEGMDGQHGGPFLRLVFRPVKAAADAYRSDRVKFRKAYQKLVDTVAPQLTKGKIAAPELGYTFGEGHNGIGHAELLHAILHTGNASNKRKLLLGRKWATENPDGTLDTSKWDAFIARMVSEGKLAKAHYDFAQGVWDLLEQTKPLAQKAHRATFGRYFAEVTADAFETPFGQYRGGYVPAQADPEIVQDAQLRDLATLENENMAFSFPAPNKGFTKSRVEYNRPLKLDLRTIGQHIDKVLLFSHMAPAARDVNKLISRKGVSYSLGRIDPTIYAGMLTPWLNRAAKQIVETPVVGDGGLLRILSAARSRAGMALMFANVSNTLQQVTGFSTAFAKLKADGLESHMMRAAAQFIAHPKKTAKTVADASEFMANRMENEIAAINDAMDDILLDPNLYRKAQAWTRKHAYFMQTAMANTMEPIIWTAAYNGHLTKNGSEVEAARYADGVIRQTQGSTLPEDVSRIETGPAYARVFSQFIGYFNMMANTNVTALKQIADDAGLKRGAGKALLLLLPGMLVPLWVAEAVAIAMRGGPEDDDDDGYLDDWLASVLGMGTIKGSLAMVPFVGQLANAGLNRFNDNPADDRVSLSPAVSLIESAVGIPVDIYKAMTDPDKLNKRNAVRDVASAISIATGLPAYAIARPLGYLAGVADDRIEPTGPIDAVRGAVTGSASPESR